MAPIPRHLIGVAEVVLDPDLTAHRVGGSLAVTPDKPDPQRRSYIGDPDRHAARCAPTGERLPIMSAYTADRRGAQACPAKACFAADIARPEPERRRLVARAQAPTKARRTRAGAGR